MKKILLLLVIVIAISCKNEANKETTKSQEKVVKKANFPEELGKVFKSHGGLDVWKNANLLSFNKGDEAHTIDLHSRKTVINSPKYSLGFDGKEVWLSEEQERSYRGNKDFYYNLYFYFYAMPFVLSDDGITYEKVDDLIFKGVNYPGYKISYASDKGTTPDDNYLVYYNSKTYQMEWLAYTVTFKSKTPSDNFKFIRYNSWTNVNGLILPEIINWYKKDDNGIPKEPTGHAVQFTLPLVSEVKLADSFFEKPKN